MSFLSTCSDELRKSVLIRNALKTASSFSSPKSRSNLHPADSELASSSSSSKERWTLMASRAGLKQSHYNADFGDFEHDNQDDQEEEEEEENDDNDDDIEYCNEGAVCQECPQERTADEEQDEIEWFEGLLQEISIEDYHQIPAIATTASTLGDSIQRHSISTSSLPSLIIDEEGEDSGEDEDDCFPPLSHIQHRPATQQDIQKNDVYHTSLSSHNLITPLS